MCMGKRGRALSPAGQLAGREADLSNSPAALALLTGPLGR